MGKRFALALIHSPALNRKGEICTTAVVNADIHDLSRLGRTFGASRFYIVTPIEAQRKLVERIAHHWREGYGATFNPLRAEALALVSVMPDLETCIENMTRLFDCRPQVCVTSARHKERVISYRRMRAITKRTGSGPFLIVFGTGWGLGDDVINAADFQLEPLGGCDGYNHLSVRCAAAIILDRLWGAR